MYAELDLKNYVLNLGT